MNKEILYKIIKILILILVVYIVCRYIPERGLSNSDILIIIMVVVALYIIFELVNKFSGDQEQFSPYYNNSQENIMSIQKRMGSTNLDNQYNAGNPSILNDHTINPIEVSDNTGIPRDTDNSITQMTREMKQNQKPVNYSNSCQPCVCPYLDMAGTANLTEWR